MTPLIKLYIKFSIDVPILYPYLWAINTISKLNKLKVIDKLKMRGSKKLFLDIYRLVEGFGLYEGRIFYFSPKVIFLAKLVDKIKTRSLKAI